MAFRITSDVMTATFATLDHREKNGYERHDVNLQFRDGSAAQGVVYIAARDNFAYLGPAPFEQMVAQIRSSHGPSGANSEYLLELCKALREHQIHDQHVFELEAGLLHAS
jgi:cation transport regulator ChaC